MFSCQVLGQQAGGEEPQLTHRAQVGTVGGIEGPQVFPVNFLVSLVTGQTVELSVAQRTLVALTNPVTTITTSIL